MIGPQLDNLARISITPLLNSLPEGILVAVFAWLMLRVLPRQNSGTRFAVWFVALLAVVGLPFSGVHENAQSLIASVRHPLLTLPGHWALLLSVGWGLAASVAIVRVAIGLWRVRQLRKSCLPLDPSELDPSLRRIVADFSSSRSVTLATSDNVSVPAALGFVNPMIVLPSWALRELTPEQLSIVLLHEFAHLQRWDDWSNLLQKTLKAVFFFHPAVWWIERQLSLEREMACDDHVLAETADPRGYAKCLIALLERNLSRRAWAMTQAVVHRAREARLRLSEILDANRTNTKHVWKPALGFVGAFCVLLLMVVPQAPQFVTFVPSTRVMHGEPTLSSLSESRLAPPAVIPAALHVSSSSIVTRRQHAAKGLVSQMGQRRNLIPQMVAGRLDENAARPNVLTTEVSEPVTRNSEAIFVIRATQQVGPNSYVWSVQVWRVMLVPDATKRAPVAKST